MFMSVPRTLEKKVPHLQAHKMDPSCEISACFIPSSLWSLLVPPPISTFVIPYFDFHKLTVLQLSLAWLRY